MKRGIRRLIDPALRNTSVVLFCILYAVLAVLSPKFREIGTLVQILVQTSSLAIVATGMTFVMLTAGIDLSVGAIMFLGAAVLGKLILGASVPIPIAVAAMLVLGAAWGALVGWLIVRFRMVPFVVTLAMLFVGRGIGLYVTQTRALNLPDAFRDISSGTLLGVPLPVAIAMTVVVLAQIILLATPFGRHVFAVGSDAAKAQKAGLPVSRVLLGTYTICGLLAVLGGVVSLSELGAVSPDFGEGEEFSAIAAAVLGGASLFGGRGSVLPGTLFGALLIQTLRSGLNILNVDPYVYPLVTSVTIFVAVWIDSYRSRLGILR